MGKAKDRVIILLNIAKVLSTTERDELKAATTLAQLQNDGGH
jgi:hypothetical protein